MNRPSFTLRAIGALLLLLLLPCSGQEGPRNVTVRTAMFPGSGIMDPLELYVGDGKEGMPVEIWGGKFSPEFELPRLEIWRFGHWETETNDEGKVVRVFKEQGRVKPPVAKRMWIVFFQTKKGKDVKLQVQAFGVDGNTLKEGGIVVMNLTKGPIGFEYPGKKLKIKPAGKAVVNPGSERGQVYPVKFYYAHNGQARPFVTTTWFHGERRKRLALVVRADESTPPKLLTIDDIAAPDEPGQRGGGDQTP